MTCVADPDNIDAYPDPNFYSDEDPDPIIFSIYVSKVNILFIRALRH